MWIGPHISLRNLTINFFQPFTKYFAKILKGLFFLLPLDEAIASIVVFVIVYGSDGRAGGRAKTRLEPTK